MPFIIANAGMWHTKRLRIATDEVKGSGIQVMWALGVGDPQTLTGGQEFQMPVFGLY